MNGARKGGDTSPSLLTAGEVAAMFNVAPRTVSRWAEAGKLSVVATARGHRRFPADEVRALLRRSVKPTADAADTGEPH